MKAAIDARAQQTGDLRLAILDIERDMAIPIMRRNVITGECEPLSAPFGKAYAIEYNPPFSVTIYRRTAIDDTPQRWATFAHQPTDRIDGWLYYVWKPYFDDKYFGSAPDDNEPLQPIERATAVLRALYLTKAVPRKLNAINKAVNDECKKRGWQSVGIDVVAGAAAQLGYRAPRKPRPPRKRRPPREHN